jgi:ABC-2 type transport system ATP-binding protein
MIVVDDLTKRYGTKTAVDALSFAVRPGMVTGFLGPNGSGKSTTMRLILGLHAPTSGSASIDGTRYAAHKAPLRDVGVLLEARAIHPGRSAFDHLLAQAQTQGIPRARVNELVEFVGLQDVAKQRAGQFSLGMGQRLGIASALLGDPATLILDEPINGLDPDGIHWMRGLLKTLAAEGRTVFLSSHLMSEMALTADHLIIIGRGRLIRDISVDAFVRESSNHVVRVRSPQSAQLRGLLVAHHATIANEDHDRLDVDGMTAEEIGHIAASHGIVLLELTPQTASLEEAFMELTHDAVEYRNTSTNAGVTDAAGVAA